MAEDVVRKLVGEQRRRMIAALLGFVEGEPWYSKLSPQEKSLLRETVLRVTTNYHEFILDVLKVSKDDVLYNERALELIQQVHESQHRMEAAAARG